MMPTTGPKLSSVITCIEWSTPTRICGARYGGPAMVGVEDGEVDHLAGPGGERRLDLAAHEVGRLAVDHRAEGGGRVQRIAQDVAGRHRSSTLDEVGVQ